MAAYQCSLETWTSRVCPVLNAILYVAKNCTPRCKRDNNVEQSLRHATMSFPQRVILVFGSSFAYLAAGRAWNGRFRPVLCHPPLTNCARGRPARRWRRRAACRRQREPGNTRRSREPLGTRRLRCGRTLTRLRASVVESDGILDA